MEFLLHIVAGASVGFAIGLTGVGGGSLMPPLLLVFGYTPPVAIGPDLLYAAITKTGGALAHHRQGNVDWKIVSILGLGSIPISIFLHTFVLNVEFQESAQFEELLTLSLGIMLIVTSIILILRNKMRKNAIEGKPKLFMPAIHRYRTSATLLMGLILGFCVTVSSVGAGAFGAAILLTIYSQITAVRVIGTDLAHAVPLTFIAGVGYLFAGYVDLMLLFGLIVGSLPAIHIGTRLSSQVPDKVLVQVLTVIMLSVGVYYTVF